MSETSTTQQRTLTSALHQQIGRQVHLQGWIHAIRRLGGINFVILRDGWGAAQIVVEDESALAPLDGLMPETVVSVQGIVRDAPQAPDGYEVAGPHFTVLSPVTEAPPVLIGKRAIKAGLPTLLDHAVVANRHPARRAIFRLAAGVMQAFRTYLTGQGFTEIQSPKLVASATESGANVFTVDYFGRPAYLAQSPQFYKQIMVGVFERVFEIGPVFRAEPHDTVRHINEYVSLDLEFGFIKDHFTVMQMLRDVLEAIFSRLQESGRAELEILQAKLPEVPQTIPHIHFADAQELIYTRFGEDVRGEPDLAPEDERRLGRWAREEFNSEFLFVTGYPMHKRPFYTHPDPDDAAYSNSFDLLFRGTELVTGGQRLHDYAAYQAAIARAGHDPDDFASYLEAFRYGMPPHGGFAIGLERLLMQLTGANNVRLTTLFPRDLARLAP